MPQSPSGNIQLPRPRMLQYPGARSGSPRGMSPRLPSPQQLQQQQQQQQQSQQQQSVVTQTSTGTNTPTQQQTDQAPQLAKKEVMKLF